METLITVIHLIAAVALIGLVLIQDSKGGGALGMGGGGANSLLGATGAQTLAAKMTRVVAIVFAVTCLTLTYFITTKNSSVIEGRAIPAPPASAPVETAPAAVTPTAPGTTPAAEPTK
ncbi:MAG: preprotein translocase subunit SecG [Pseudobdellovibrionaceae bacterium]|jgi:preprotein translocase subunit SecG